MMKTVKTDVEEIRQRNRVKKAFLEAYLDICNKYQLDFTYNDAGGFSVDSIPVHEDLMSLRAYSEFSLEELNETERLLGK